MNNNSLKKDLTATQDLSETPYDPFSYTSSTNRKFKLEEVILHFSTTVTETVTVSRVSKSGSNYTHVLAKRGLSAEQDFIFRPTGECNFQDGDEVKVECTDANHTGVLFMTIKRSEILL